MSLARMMSIPCTVASDISIGEKDRHGDPITERVEQESVCAFQQRRRDESEVGGEVSDTLWSLYLPWGTEIGSGASVTVEGRAYEVVGEAWPAREGSRRMWHVEATVRRRAGTGES